ncbi:5-oxoprolinase subunit B family protein [Chachezhania sediminis]|uniref:5-oxoprolinase subunit B family protein n=1 Tax=Chachezhania sediminis TaxID=2599291 RepID=UPI00131B270A|nr:allophanate hydrolase subunit 1 [Chachezhania sediminis]
MGTDSTQGTFPLIRTVGIDGMLVTFAPVLEDRANCAALAFRAAVDAAEWDGVIETATTLTSVHVRFDPLYVPHDAIRGRLEGLLAGRDWMNAPLPDGRRLWTVPVVFGTDLAPQLGEAAAEAGMTEDQAIESLTSQTVRVLTIGFAPGMPYMGPLTPAWDIPRQKALTPKVPEGALVLAIRQVIVFTSETPTGWRHVGQTAFRGFRPEAEEPFALQPGDEMRFTAIGPADLEAIRADNATGMGGAKVEEIA